MANIFISYAREDREFTQLLARRLEDRGWSVWWDRRIPTGKLFEKVIEEELHKAGCVIAVWSRHGVSSDYVREEAADGRDRGILLPVFAETVGAPFGFRGIQAADLRGWNGDPAHPGFLDFVHDISGKIGPPRQRAQPRGTPPADDEATVQAPREPLQVGENKPSVVTPRTRRLGMAGLTLLIASGAIGWWWSEGRVPTEAAWKPAATAGPSAAPNQQPVVAEPPEAARAPSTTPVPRPEEARPQADAEKTVSSAQKTRAPGDVFRDCDVCPEMVVLPAGQFQMGSPESEKARDGNEGPRHKVTIADPFAISKYEVTFKQWDACAEAGGCNRYRPDDKEWGRGRRPVISVSWRDTKAYVEWLSEKTGKAYRLPSEAEWEYAARAGTTTRYSFGDQITPKDANYWESKIGKTTEVGSYPPNPWGLYDMHGNVWEWVEDVWHDSYTGAPTDGSAWTGGEGTDSSRNRVLRGGSWLKVSRGLRSANRIAGDPDDRVDVRGFRVSRTLD